MRDRRAGRRGGVLLAVEGEWEDKNDREGRIEAELGMAEKGLDVRGAGE